MFTFNRNEQIAIIVLTAVLIVGSIVSAVDYFWPSDIEHFEVRKAAIPVPDIQEKTESHDAPAERIDINTASAKALTALPQIGPKTAELIVAYRAEHGPFKHVDDLARIKGIGPRTLETLRPLVVPPAP